jgi:hypothetical protein
MALNKQIVTDKIEVLENGVIQVRVATRIDEDGVILSTSFHRHTLAPGDSLTGQDVKVSDIATATWTTAVIDDYKAAQLANEV